MVLIVGSGSLCAVTGALAVQTCLRATCGELPAPQPNLDGSVSPKKLPRHEYAPVTASLSARIATAGGPHPAALRETVVDIDKDVKINVKGYPVCEGSRRDLLDPNATKKACGPATLGSGRAHVEIAFPEQKPILVTSPLTVFNGGEKGGKVTLLIYTLITVPAPRQIITTVTIKRKGTGIHSIAKIPVIAGGSGSLLDFHFRLGTSYTYKGKKLSILEARCPDEVFKVTSSFLFKNEARAAGVAPITSAKGSLTVPCTPKG